MRVVAAKKTFFVPTSQSILSSCSQMSCPGSSLTLLHFGICLDIVQVHALDAQFNNKISKEVNVEPPSSQVSDCSKLITILI
jgi:hypothetical protein